MPEANGDPTSDEMASGLGWSPSDGPEEMIDLGGDAGDTTPDVPAATPDPAGFAVGSDQQQPDAFTDPNQVNPPQQQQPNDPMRQELQRQNMEMRRQQVRDQINQGATARMQGLIDQGLDRDTAYREAKLQADVQWGQYQNQELQSVAENQAKAALSFELAAQYGVPREQLMNYSDPQSMSQAAKMYAETTGKINSLQAQLNGGNRAPVQSFDSNSINSGNSPTALKLRYSTDPNFNPTPEQLAAMGLR